MKAFCITEKNDGKNVIRATVDFFPGVSPILLHKALRKKDIRINGKKIGHDQPVCKGDMVEIWLPDKVFATPKNKVTDSDISYSTVFENKEILIVNKPQGLPVHSGRGIAGDTLIDRIRKDIDDSAAKNINLFHRIDQNTGGLVLLAKSKESLRNLTQLLKKGQITKRYHCLVKGVPDMGVACRCADGTVMKELHAYMEKAKNGIFLHDENHSSFLSVNTRYRVLQVWEKTGKPETCISELQVELVTGRTHQIRVHMAYIGHPVLGDGKYGRNTFNRSFHTKTGAFLTRQQLFSSSLLFGDIPPENGLCKLSGQVFSIEPDYQINLC